ncbi:hypothetical protein [Aurantimonas marina]|uniref:hypothetical protein n=1 Tax=Aurantimonas marina TaxID=2780508 RepID=UPI0019CFC254|nr:hypothetical protein [Aurantimonas marina]
MQSFRETPKVAVPEDIRTPDPANKIRTVLGAERQGLRKITCRDCRSTIEPAVHQQLSRGTRSCITRPRVPFYFFPIAGEVLGGELFEHTALLVFVNDLLARSSTISLVTLTPGDVPSAPHVTVSSAFALSSFSTLTPPPLPRSFALLLAFALAPTPLLASSPCPARPRGRTGSGYRCGDRHGVPPPSAVPSRMFRRPR